MDDVVAEIMVAAALLPLAFTDSCARIDGSATVSDASEAGGGACVSSGVAEQNAALLDASLFAGARCPRRPRAVVIGLFDGAGGLRVALSWTTSPPKLTRAPEELSGYVGLA